MEKEHIQKTSESFIKWMRVKRFMWWPLNYIVGSSAAIAAAVAGSSVPDSEIYAYFAAGAAAFMTFVQPGVKGKNASNAFHVAEHSYLEWKVGQIDDQSMLAHLKRARELSQGKI